MKIVYDGQGIPFNVIIDGIHLERGKGYELTNRVDKDYQIGEVAYARIKDHDCIHKVNDDGSYSYNSTSDRVDGKVEHFTEVKDEIEVPITKEVKRKISNLEVFKKKPQKTGGDKG